MIKKIILIIILAIPIVACNLSDVNKSREVSKDTVERGII